MRRLSVERCVGFGSVVLCLALLACESGSKDDSTDGSSSTGATGSGASSSTGATSGSGLGLWIAGIPFAALLTAVIFLLGVAQLGPLPVMGLAVGWLYWSDHPGMGTFLLVWTIVIGALDNVMRPILIKRGADLPLLLIFSGVIGGLLAFGLVGLFIGPVLLGITYKLLNAWIDEVPEPRTPLPPAASLPSEQPAAHPTQPHE